MKTNQTVKICLLACVFLLAFSVGTQLVRSQLQYERELESNPTTKYLRENYGVDTIDEYQLEQEAYLNYTKSVEQYWANYSTPDYSKSELGIGTSTYQPTPMQTETYPWWINLANTNPFVELSVFSMSGLSFLAMLAIPKTGKKLLKKKWLLAIIIVAFVFYAGFMIGQTVAQSSSPNRYFEGYELPYSYMISTDGTYYYAVRYDGYLAYGGSANRGGVSGTDASAVIQAALDALTSGRTWKEKVTLKGNFEIGAELLIDSYTILELQGKITQKANANLRWLLANKNVSSTTATNTQIEVYGGIWDSNYANQATYVKGDAFEGACLAFYNCDHCSFDNIKGINFGQYGVLVVGGSFDINIGTIYGTHGIGRSGYSGVVFLTGGTLTAYGKGTERANNFVVNSVFGRDIDGPGVFLEDSPYYIVIGNVVIIQYSSSFFNKGSGVQTAGASDFNIGSIYAYKTSRGLIINSQNFTPNRKNMNIGKVIALNCAYDGVLLMSESATSLYRSDINIGLIIAKNNCQTPYGANGGLFIYGYMGGIQIGQLIATDDQTTKTQFYGLVIGNNADSIEVLQGDVSGNKYGAVSLGTGITNLKLKNLLGYVTENSGTATITAATSKVVTHGLAETPTIVELTPETTGLTSYYVSARNSTTFTITVAPSGTYTFDWYAEYKP